MNKINKKYLVDFETEVAKRYENGEIKAPIHLSGGNEPQPKQGMGSLLVSPTP